MIKVLIVDDQAMIRKGLKMQIALQPDLQIVGEAGDGLAAIQLSQKLLPDVVVMDVELPGMDGITATERLRTLAPGCAVVILSLHGDCRTRSRAQAAGAVDFVEKQGGAGPLFTAIRQAVKKTLDDRRWKTDGTAEDGIRQGKIEN